MTITMDGSHPIGLLIHSEDVILSIATFLSAKDCFNLHAVNRGWHDVISKHDETLFKNHLRYDFDEGEVLDYVAENQNLSYKKLYRAFRGRWSLPKQADPKIRAASNRYDGDRNTRILIPWAKPPEENPREQYQGAKLLVPNDDVDNVVFIARLGGDDGGDTHCALMDWNPESNPKGRLNAQQLIIDQSWSDDRGNLVLPKVDYIYGEYNPLTLTLHAIDTKYYQVASLLEDSPMDIDGYLRDREEHSKLKLYYGYDGPTLYGVPFKGSPFCRELKHDDFEYFRGGWEWGRDREYPPLDYVSTGGALVLDEVESERLVDDNYDDEEDYEYDYDYEYKLHYPKKGVYFSFGHDEMSSVKWPHQVCSFLRALMKEKCLHLEPRELLGSVAQQPGWIQDDEILDTITSFLCFEDQAGKLRLICRQFGDSALRQLQAKLEKAKRIGFMRDVDGLPDIWFEATVRRGWSEDCLTSKESAIDDALWLASCRCYHYEDSCGDKGSCKNASKHLECRGYNSKTKTTETQIIDEVVVRQSLRDEGSGSVRLTERDPDDRSYRYIDPNKVECSFEEEEMNLFDLCRKVEKEILSGIDDGDGLHQFTGMPFGLGWKLSKDYGVVYPSSTSWAGYTTCKQFVRSIFLLFTRVPSKVTADEDGSKKKPRSVPSKKITIGMAHTNITVEDGKYARAKKIIRFYSANNEPIEICLESRRSSRKKRTYISFEDYSYGDE